MAFFSPMAAFVTGFANQANENIQRQNAEDRQNDLIWANKFEKGKAEYEKENKDAKEKTKFYNTLVDTFGGNQKAADLAFQVAGQNPKNSMQAISWVSENIAAGKLAQPEGYQPTSLADIQDSLSSKYQNLQDLRGSARQGSLFRSGNTYANNMQMPRAPGDISLTSSSPSYGGGSDTTTTPRSPTPLQAGNSPDSVIQPGSTLDTSIGSASPSGAPIPLDSTAGAVAAPGAKIGAVGEGTSAKLVDMATGKPIGSTTMAQATPPVTGGVRPSVGPTNNPNAPVIPYRSAETQRQADQTYIARQHLDVERQRLELDKQRKPATPEQASNLATGAKIAEKYLDDPKIGLAARYAQLQDLQGLKYDVNSMAEILNKGLMAGKGQAPMDELNRFTSRFLGLDLAQMGFTNSPSDVQLMKKDVANAMIDRLKTLHFGRITNYTENIVKQGMPSTDNDPDTNIRIVLAIQDTLKSAAEMAQLEYNTVYNPANQEALKTGQKTWQDVMFEARNAGMQYNNEYLKKSQPFPTVGKIGDVAQMETGTWFENQHDKHMYRFLGIDGDGTLRLQNAGTKNGGLPQVIAIPKGAY